MNFIDKNICEFRIILSWLAYRKKTQFEISSAYTPFFASNSVNRFHKNGIRFECSTKKCHDLKVIETSIVSTPFLALIYIKHSLNFIDIICIAYTKTVQFKRITVISSRKIEIIFGIDRCWLLTLCLFMSKWVIVSLCV